MKEDEDDKMVGKEMTLEILDSSPKSYPGCNTGEESGEKLVKSKSKDNSYRDEDDDLQQWSEISESDTLKHVRQLLILIVLTVLTVVNYIVSNVNLVVKYSEAADTNRYVRMTLSYMIAPIFITTLIHLAWYIDDDLQAKDNGKPPTPRKIWWLRGVFLFLQMGTILRYVQSLIYGYRSKHNEGRKKAKCVKRMVTLEKDATLLRSFTSFMQGVPQYALQLYILTEGPEMLLKDGVFWQILSMASCIGTISWATVSCDRILMSSSARATAVTDWRIIALLVPWRLFSIASRMTILALFSTLFPVYFGLGCVAHYLIMYVFIQRQKVTTHNGTRGEIFLFLVGGLVYIVTDLVVKYERSYHKYLVYYSIMFAEGVVMMLVWYFYTNIQPFYAHVLLIALSTSFILGIIFLRIFYEYVHVHARICCFSTCCKKQIILITDVEDEQPRV